MRRRRMWLLAILLVGIAVALATHGVKTYFLYNKEPERPVKIRVLEGERSLLALPHYIAMAQGFYKEQKLDVESAVLDDSSKDELSLTGKNADVLLGNLCQTVFTRPLGTGAELVAFAGLARRDGTFLLGHQDIQEFTWEKLKRKTILGDAPDTQSNIILEEAIKQNKLTLQHQVIIIQNLPPALKEGAFQAGVGDYVQMSEPLASLAEDSGIGKTVAFLGTTVDSIPSLVFLAPENYLKQQDKANQKLVNGLCKGMLWLDYHSPVEAARVTAPYFPDIDKQLLTKIIAHYKKLGLWDKTPVIAEEDYEQLQGYVRRAGELTNPVAFKYGVNTKYAKKASKTVEYIPPEQQREKTWWEKVKTLDFK